METILGTVERIIFHNPENGYTVLRLRPDRGSGLQKPALDREGLITVTGNLPELNPGEFLKINGQWGNHPRHGYQFNAEICESTLPATLSGIRRYLGSGLIKGIGPRLAERIVAHFGRASLDIIEEQPEKLLEVQDIGPKRSQRIKQAWEEQRQVKDIMLFLHSHGVTTNLAVKIYKTYGNASLQTVQNNPYQLARDIYGVGFKTADKIAQDMGLAHDQPSRIEAGIIYTLNEMSNEGHVFSPQKELISQVVELLEINPELIPPALGRLSQENLIHSEIIPPPLSPTPIGQNQQKDVKIETEAAEAQQIFESPLIYLTPYYYAEKGISERLGELIHTLSSRQNNFLHSFHEMDPHLSAEQTKAIHTALAYPVSVLTGGPGTGKTTCLKALIKILDSISKRYALASPTGRAAKRLSEATGRPASTIHRLLGYSPLEGFKYNIENPLPIDFLVIDEASMLDLHLAYNLFKTLRPGTHLMLVGDVDQLPSVGAGDVLRDIINSGVAPVTRLHAIFRQASNSQIITNAHRINEGNMPIFSTAANRHFQSDFYLFSAKDAENASTWVIDVVTQRIPNKFGFDPVHDIQVLSPMYRGAAGVQTLNDQLQNALNPPNPNKPEVQLFGTRFRPGDKVMQIQNNYDKDVFNGDIGIVTGIDSVEQILTIEIDGRSLLYDFTEADQLVLAYAVTVHKAQGSEFPVVVMVLVTAHYMMLQRNLLYTGITRAQKLCVLVGNHKAIGIAVRNNKVAQRYTALGWRLRNFR